MSYSKICSSLNPLKCFNNVGICLHQMGPRNHALRCSVPNKYDRRQANEATYCVFDRLIAVIPRNVHLCSACPLIDIRLSKTGFLVTALIARPYLLCRSAVPLQPTSAFPLTHWRPCLPGPSREPSSHGETRSTTGWIKPAAGMHLLSVQHSPDAQDYTFPPTSSVKKSVVWFSAFG